MKRREFFDDHAASWRDGAPPDMPQRLRRVVALAQVHPAERVLDLGSGTGVLIPHLLEALGPSGSVVAGDFSAEMLRQSAANRWDQRVALVQTDALRLPFSDGAFHRVLCNAALPHFPDKQAALSEMARVLRAGGVMVIAHPIGRRRVAQIHRAAGGPVGEDRVPDVATLSAMLRRAGAQVAEAVDEPEFYLVSARL